MPHFGRYPLPPMEYTRMVTSIRQFLHTTDTKILLNEPWTPHPRRRWDRNIMEDTHRLLPHNTLMALNNVRLYLCVTYLSEITDASGLYIQSEYLLEAQPSQASTLHWPFQIPPLPANWKLWTQSIHTLYTKASSVILRQPLGPWDTRYAFQHWTWEWRIDPTSHTLYHMVNQ